MAARCQRENPVCRFRICERGAEYGQPRIECCRFTDFLLPPLTFAEFIDLRDRDGLIERDGDGWFATDIEELNREFIQYLNFGGYPEVALGSALQENPVRLMRACGSRRRWR